MTKIEMKFCASSLLTLRMNWNDFEKRANSEYCFRVIMYVILELSIEQYNCAYCASIFSCYVFLYCVTGDPALLFKCIIQVMIFFSTIRIFNN